MNTEEIYNILKQKYNDITIEIVQDYLDRILNKRPFAYDIIALDILEILNEGIK